MAQQVFISHSHEDEAAFSALALALDSSGVSRWDTSRLALGQPLAEELRKAIEDCDLCIFLATARSLRSRWCLAELGAFWGAGKKVIVYLADPEVDKAQLPPQFQGNLGTTDAARLVQAIQAADGGRVGKTASGYSTRIGKMTVEVTLGRLEETACTDRDCLLALPANEFFDDDCIHDARSSLGAFVQRHFPKEVPDLTRRVQQELADEPSKEVKKKKGESAFSYGIGKCVFLNRPLKKPYRIAMVAVTRQREERGLHSDPVWLFEAMASLQTIAADNRLFQLVVPLLGSGHGDLAPEASLVCMLLALDRIRRGEGHKFTHVNIVVFRAAPDAAPKIRESRIVSALNLANSLGTE